MASLLASTSLAGDVDGENVGPRFWKMKYTLMWLRVFGRSCSCAEFDIHIIALLLALPFLSTTQNPT